VGIIAAGEESEGTSSPTDCQPPSLQQDQTARLTRKPPAKNQLVGRGAKCERLNQRIIYKKIRVGRKRPGDARSRAWRATGKGGIREKNVDSVPAEEIGDFRV